MSNNLNRTEVAENLATPEPLINGSDGILDAVLTELLTVDVTNANGAVTALQSRVASILVTGAAVARDVVLTAAKRQFSVRMASTNAANVTLKCGTTSIVMSPGQSGILSMDGTANGLFLVVGSMASQGFSIGTFIAGKPGASEKLIRFKTPKAFTLPVALTGSQFVAEVAATASTTFTITKNGTSIGTLAFAASGTVPTITFATATAFVVGDVLGLNAPATADATLADISFTFAG